MKTFEIPELWVVAFGVEDVLTTSGGLGDGGDDSGAIGGGAWEDELPR